MKHCRKCGSAIRKNPGSHYDYCSACRASLGKKFKR